MNSGAQHVKTVRRGVRKDVREGDRIQYIHPHIHMAMIVLLYKTMKR